MKKRKEPEEPEDEGPVLGRARKKVTAAPPKKKAKPASDSGPSPASSSAAAAPVNGRVNHNKLLTDILEQLGENEKASGNIYKARAYAKAVESLKKHPAPITSGKEAMQLEGIGKKIAQKIQEILDTGKLKRLEEDKKNEKLQALTLLTKVYGIGPKRAAQLVNEHGIRTLEDLKKHRELLNETQQIGLDLFDDLQQRIPREEIQQMEAYLKDAAKRYMESKHVKMELVICGSYRRGAPTSGDIDVLVTDPAWVHGKKRPAHLAGFVSFLEKEGFITHTLGLGDTKFSGICKLLRRKETAESKESKEPAKSSGRVHRRIDIRFIPADQFACGALYFTGSDSLNVTMRKRAQELGLLLSEYGLYKMDPETGEKGEALPVKTEEDVFKALGMPYLPPEQR